MMKKHLGVILLAVAAVVLGGIYLWLETTDNAMISGALYSLAEDEEIVSISIHNRYGEYDFELAENGRWTVTRDGNSYRTHASKMEENIHKANKVQCMVEKFGAHREERDMGSY